MKRTLASTSILLLFLSLVTVVILVFSAVGYYFTKPDAVTETISVSSDKITLILDAGHGGEDGGAEANGVLEKDINLRITKALANYFAFTPYNVQLTRSDDRLLYKAGEEKRKKYHDLINRVSFAKSYENAVFISIHQNKFEIPKYKGLQVYYSPNHPDSALLAEKIQENTRVYLDASNTRQTKKADHKIRVLKSLETPAVLVECGFLSNPEEAALLSQNEYQNKLAFTIFLSVIQYLETLESL